MKVNKIRMELTNLMKITFEILGHMHESTATFESTQYAEFMITNFTAAKAPPITVEVKLDGCLVNMEVDTGASLSLMSEVTFSAWAEAREEFATFQCQASDLPQRAHSCCGLLLCKCGLQWPDL